MADFCCGAVIAEREGRMPDYSERVFRAYFEAGRDISQPDVVIDIATAAGLDRSGFAISLREPAVMQQVWTHCDTLIERGGFGSPTMFVGSNMFFGNDRVPLVEFALGQTSGRTFTMPGQHS